MRRLLAIAAVGGLLVVGCSKTEETSTSATSTTPATAAPGTTEREAPATTAKKKPGTTSTTKKKGATGEARNPDSEYCQQAQTVADLFADGNDINPMDDTEAEAFSAFLGDAAKAAEEIVAVAPDEVVDDWQTMADTFGKLAAVPPAKVFEEMMGLGSEIDDAGKRIDEFTVAECGFPISSDSSSSGGTTDDGSTTDSTLADGDTKITIDGIQAFLDDQYGQESWVEDLDSWSVSTVNGEVTIVVGSPSSSDAVAACDAIGEYAGALTPELIIEVNAADGTALARKAADQSSCAAA